MNDGLLGDPRLDMRTGAGMRVVNGEDSGFAYTEDLTAVSLVSTAQQASVMAGEPLVLTP